MVAGHRAGSQGYSSHAVQSDAEPPRLPLAERIAIKVFQAIVDRFGFLALYLSDAEYSRFEKSLAEIVRKELKSA